MAADLRFQRKLFLKPMSVRWISLYILPLVEKKLLQQTITHFMYKVIFFGDKLISVNGDITSAHADELKLKQHDGRLNHKSNTPGKLAGDDAGYLFADQFGGSPDLDNLVSQRSDLNRAVKNTDNYRSMEREWSKALKSGQKVTDVDIKLSYQNGTSRPSSFPVTYKIEGESFRRIFNQ